MTTKVKLYFQHPDYNTPDEIRAYIESAALTERYGVEFELDCPNRKNYGQQAHNLFCRSTGRWVVAIKFCTRKELSLLPKIVESLSRWANIQVMSLIQPTTGEEEKAHSGWVEEKLVEANDPEFWRAIATRMAYYGAD